jgi:hypothetical protein
MRALIVVAAVLALAPATARAEDHWYGDHVLIADGIGWGLVGGAFATRTWQLGATGLVTMTLGGPVVHLSVHENLGRAGISVGLRTVLPILGLVAGSAGDHNNDDHESVGNGIAIGLAAGYVIAQLIDIVVVANEDIPGATPRMVSFGGRF